MYILTCLRRQNLNSKYQIAIVIKKLNTFCGLIYKVRHMYRQKYFLVFLIFFRNILIRLWYTNKWRSQKTNMEAIDTDQRNILGAICYKKRSESFQQIYSDENVLNIYEIYIGKVLQEVLKLLKTLCPMLFSETNEYTNVNNTRRKHKNCYLQRY